MIALPAVDIRDGCCVQLVGGEYERERVRLDNPVAIALSWGRLGFKHLHVVDLDAALGKGSNHEVVADILRAWQGDVQVGGGVRSAKRIEELLELGASRVIVGTQAVDDSAWLTQMCQLFPDLLVVAADARERKIVTRGWTTDTAIDVIDFARRLDDEPLAGLMVTAVHREGRLEGTDIGLMSSVVCASRHRVQASGGVADVRDLRDLAACGVSATVIGMAVYTGAIDPRATAEEFGE